jgi:hypothetical protein
VNNIQILFLRKMEPDQQKEYTEEEGSPDQQK